MESATTWAQYVELISTYNSFSLNGMGIFPGAAGIISISYVAWCSFPDFYLEIVTKEILSVQENNLFWLLLI